MSVHPTDATLEGIAAHAIGGAELLAALQHIRTCATCSQRMAALAKPVATALRFREELHAHDEEFVHPEVEVLASYVDGSLAAGARDAIETHVAICDACAADVAEMRAVQERAEPPSRQWTVWLAVAAVLALAVIGTLLSLAQRQGSTLVEPLPSRPPEVRVAPHLPSHPEWDEAVASARRERRFTAPAVYLDLLSTERFRGEEGESSRTTLAPDRTVLDETRPTFSWTSPASARTATVYVFDGRELVMKSPVLRESRWSPARDLARGRSYSWQVELRGPGSEIETLPVPPAPPARFAIITEDAHRELEEARVKRGDDVILLATLYARLGMRNVAIEVLQSGPQDADARALLQSLHTWPK